MSGTVQGEERPSGRLFWATAAGVLVLDFVTKRLAERFLFPPHTPHEVIGETVRLTLAYNRGAAFSMKLGSDLVSRLVFGGFAVIALIVLWRLFRESRAHERLKILALSLCWGGAAGNLTDRILSSRGVVDFIDIGVGTTRFWTFNVADSAVTVGAIALGWVLLQEDREQRRRERAARAADAA
jgi:signal peptidase II